MKFVKRTVTKLSVITVLALAVNTPAMAQTHKGYGDEWQNAVALYAWGAGISGTTSRGTGIDIDFDDLLDNLEGGFMGSYQGRKGRWSVLADVLVLDVEGERQRDLIPPIGPGFGLFSAEAKVGMEGTVFQALGGYNLYNREGTSSDFIFGARYLDLSTDLIVDFSLSLPETEPLRRFEWKASDDLWDAVVGFKGRIGLGDRWYLPYYADIGAGDSDFTWQASAGIAFRAADWVDIALAYRYLAWDIGGELIEDLNFSGPALGVVFRF